MHKQHTLTTIAIARTPFKEKFGIPRQPGLAPSIESRIELLEPYNRPETVKGLEGYSHIWLLFMFHATQEQGWSPTVRPPRLGGNRRLGVFATRSTFRPNALGLSCVRLLGVEVGDKTLHLRVSGADLMDGTPVVDIKPYIPFSDSHADATAELVPDAPAVLDVTFTETAAAACTSALRQMITEVLSQDPRPAYQDDAQREYGVCLNDVNVRFVVNRDCVVVLSIAPIRNPDAGAAPA